MNHKVQQEEITQDKIKKEFQLERMILFSDVVFAIVITLFVINLKLQEGVIDSVIFAKKYFIFYQVSLVSIFTRQHLFF